MVVTGKPPQTFPLAAPVSDFACQGQGFFVVLKGVRKFSLPGIGQTETAKRMLLSLPLANLTRKRKRLHMVLNRMLGFPHVAIGGSCIPEERRLSVPVFRPAGRCKRRLQPFNPFNRCLPDGQYITANDRVSGANLIRPFILLRIRTGPPPSRFDVRPFSIVYVKSLAQAFASPEKHLISAGKDCCSVFRKLLLNRPALVVGALCGRPQTQ
jgi:hypothetical protein